MNAPGFFTVQRGLRDAAPLFDSVKAPISTYEAWLWIGEKAAYAERSFSVNGKEVSLQRGQLSTSIRHLAKEFRWDEKRVRRYLARLKDAAWITTADAAGQTLITICNYEEKFGFGHGRAAPLNDGTPHERRTDAAQENQGKELNKQESPPSPQRGETVTEESNVVFLRSVQDVCMNVRAAVSTSAEGKALNDACLLPGLDLDPVHASPKRHPTVSASSKPPVTREMLHEAEAIWNRHASECGLATSRGMKSNREKLVRDRLAGDCDRDLRKWEEFVLACVDDQWLNDTNQTLDYVCTPRNFDRILDKADARKRNAKKPAFAIKKQVNGKAPVGSSGVGTV